MHEDLVIVYKEMVMNSKLQLEKPMSRALAIPVADSFRTFSDQQSDIRGMPSNQIQCVLYYNRDYLYMRM